MADLTTRDQEKILDRLRNMLARRDPIPSLAGSAYMRAHIAFESSSDQQAQILAWLLKHLREKPGKSLSIASVGAGSGTLDVPLLKELAHEKKVDYLGLDPLADHYLDFERRALDHLDPENPCLELVQSALEEFEPNRQYDMVLAIHSFYYFKGLSSGLRRLLDLAAPGGEVIVALAPRGEMNRLAELFWRPLHGEPVWFEDDVRREFAVLGVEPTRECIDAELVFDPEGPDGLDITSFLIQSPLEQVGPAERDLLFAYLREVGELRGNRLSVPHPVSILSVRV